MTPACFLNLLKRVNAMLEDERFDYVPTSNCPDEDQKIDAFRLWNEVAEATNACEDYLAITGESEAPNPPS